ncbi:MAG: divalent-cation tolerance protein CutA, partial [Vicinamibacterales bacterium]|nr:divalent-cation tolerance protein CutA [Vicinamibacterales bacterium]
PAKAGRTEGSVSADRCVIVLTTMPTADAADRLATTLVEERLAACVNILPEMRSVYRWDGQIERGTEHQIVMKTTPGKVGALHARVEALHPYAVAEILDIQASGGGAAYLKWVTESVG